MIIYGWRYMGAVEGRGGQHVRTRFIHVFFLPVVPLSSRWFIDPATSHEMTLHGKSVAAGYARWWLPVLGIGAIATGAILPVVVGAGALGAAAWTWRWRNLSDARATKRSDMNLAAFGTRCEPRSWTREFATDVRDRLDVRWADVADGKSPSDVARFGADSPHQAITAYGVLRVSAALLTGEQAAEAETDAQRIVDDLREVPEALGPYRSPAQLAGTTDDSAADGSAAGSVDGAGAARAPRVDVDAVANPLADALESALAADRFVPLEAPPLGQITVDRLLFRQAWLSRYAVIQLRMPDDFIGFGMYSKGVANLLRQRFRASTLRPLTVFVIWVGESFGDRVGKLDIGLIGGDVSVRGIYVVDAATKRVTAAEGSAHDLTKRLRAKVSDIVYRAI